MTGNKRVGVAIETQFPLILALFLATCFSRFRHQRGMEWPSSAFVQRQFSFLKTAVFSQKSSAKTL
jgi:hypothetical protein